MSLDDTPSPLELLLQNNGFTTREIDKIVDSDYGPVRFEIELWARWFGSHEMCDTFFVKEHSYPDLSPEKIVFLLEIVHRFHNNRHNMVLSTCETEQEIKTQQGLDSKTEQWLIKYPNGQVRQQGCFINEQKHGEWKEFHPNGKISWRRFYVNGRQHGLSEWWDINGSLESDCIYIYGKPQTRYEPYINDEKLRSLGLQ